MEQYVVFDIDGTLNRTDLYAVEAYQKALHKRGRDVDRQEIISCIGLSPAEIIKKLFGSLTEEEWTAWRRDIKSYEFDLMKKYARTFDGIGEALHSLKEKGYKTAICSNAFPDHIDGVLAAIGVKEYFDVIGSLELGKDKTEALGELLRRLGNPNACMVGDRKFDKEAARANRIPFIGCAYGYAPDEVQEADVVVTEPLEIIEAVCRLMPERQGHE